MSNHYILIAEDNEDDRFLITKAIAESQIDTPVVFKVNGRELWDHLESENLNLVLDKIDLIILDLNLPGMDGRTVLKGVKDHFYFKMIPILVLTTSASHADIVLCYKAGVAGYIVKPSDFEGFINIFKTVKKYWYDTVERPNE